MHKTINPNPARLRQRVRVLIVANSDGFIEAYGESSVSVHIAQRLHTDGGSGSEVDADEYLDRVLPGPFKELYYPNKLLTVGQCQKVTAEDEVNRRENLAVLREVRNLAAPAVEVPQAIAKARRAGE